MSCETFRIEETLRRRATSATCRSARKGSATAVVDGSVRNYSVDEPGSWAIYRDLPDGGRLVTLYLMHEPSPGDFERLRMDFSVNAADATGNVVQIDLLSSVGVGGTYIDGIMVSASITFGDLSDGRVRANVDATLASGHRATWCCRRRSISV